MGKLHNAQLYCFDGDADSCDLMCTIFERENCQVTGAGSLEEALSKIKGKKFDLFILDKVCPNGEGIELCRKIMETSLSAPIIFCSTGSRENRLGRCAASWRKYVFAQTCRLGFFDRGGEKLSENR